MSGRRSRSRDRQLVVDDLANTASLPNQIAEMARALLNQMIPNASGATMSMFTLRRMFDMAVLHMLDVALQQCLPGTVIHIELWRHIQVMFEKVATTSDSVADGTRYIYVLPILVQVITAFSSNGLPKLLAGTIGGGLKGQILSGFGLAAAGFGASYASGAPAALRDYANAKATAAILPSIPQILTLLYQAFTTLWPLLEWITKMLRSFTTTEISASLTGIFVATVYYGMLFVAYQIATHTTGAAGELSPETFAVVEENINTGMTTVRATLYAELPGLYQVLSIAAVSKLAASGSVGLFENWWDERIPVRQESYPITAVGSEGAFPREREMIWSAARAKVGEIGLDEMTKRGLADATARVTRAGTANPSTSDIDTMVKGILDENLGGKLADVPSGAYEGWVWVSDATMAAATGKSISGAPGLAVNPKAAYDPLRMAKSMFVPVGGSAGLIDDSAEAGKLAQHIFGTQLGKSGLAKWQWSPTMVAPSTIHDLFSTVVGINVYFEFVDDLLGGNAKTGTERYIAKAVMMLFVAQIGAMIARPNDKSLDTVSGLITRPFGITGGTIAKDRNFNYNRLLLASWNRLCAEELRSDDELEDYIKRVYDQANVDVEVRAILEFRKDAPRDSRIKKLLTTAELDTSLDRQVRFILFSLIPPSQRGIQNRNVRKLFDKIVWLAEPGTCQYCQSIRKVAPTPGAPLFRWTPGDPAFHDPSKELNTNPTRFSARVWPRPMPNGDQEYADLYAVVEADFNGVSGMKVSCINCYASFWARKVGAIEGERGRSEMLTRVLEIVNQQKEAMGGAAAGELTREKYEAMEADILKLNTVSDAEYNKQMLRLAGYVTDM